MAHQEEISPVSSEQSAAHDHDPEMAAHKAFERGQWHSGTMPEHEFSGAASQVSIHDKGHMGAAFAFPELSTPAPSSKPGPRESRWPWGKTGEQKLADNFHKQFSGKRGWDGRFFYKPYKPDQEINDTAGLSEKDYGGTLSKDKSTGKFEYRNQFGQMSSKYSDVAVYLSPTNYVPKRLLVQATEYVLRNHRASGDWRRKKLTGDVPATLRLSEWALGPFDKRTKWGKVEGTLRLFLVCVPLQLCLAWPFSSSWDDDDVVDEYTDFPGYHWQWAKHAINPLDQKPDPDSPAVIEGPQLPSTRQRLIRPRNLVVQQPDGNWSVDGNAPKGQRYIFISYADKSFSSDEGRQRIQRMAANAALEAGYTAYWLDFLCRAREKGDLLDSDVYRMCDVIRGSSKVVVMLPDATVESKKHWGARMWTLPEALLAHGASLSFCTPVGDDGDHTTESLTLVEMTAEVWDDPEDAEEDGGPTRLLAEHYSNELTLSRLELFTKALDALARRSERDYKFFTPNDVTYALMGLLHYRIKRDDTDTPFQSLAQLSLSNDSDCIIERMISLYPQPGYDSLNPFRALAREDLFHTYLWSIEPTCQVVGVAFEDNTILVDSCRVMHIRWKGFPRTAVTRDFGFRKLLATIFVTSGTWWFLQGISLAVYYAPFISTANADAKVLHVIEWMVAGFLFVAVLLSAFGPLSVRRLYGGQVLQSTSNLVGFEGVLPLAEVERLVFGNNNSRLSYDASSTPFIESTRDPVLRKGTEPKWVANPLTATPSLQEVECRIPRGHRLFTLVDTGELSVSIFSAERPPTVALLAGREGGMLRAVLCSWRFENDCLYKEAVVRMPTNVYEAASPKGWLKLCLGTLDQERGRERAVLAKKRAAPPTGVVVQPAIPAVVVPGAAPL
ncbi:hypothetical protein BX600DRAFT_510197 [Xylariales sp. PMI_506]|nr:hypothetical protein BX600DRAFT_510197 [Xylariales sp. PMI_506]